MYADEQFVFNGRLFLKDGRQGTIFDGFPTGPMPDGWVKQIRADQDGYDLVEKATGTTIFGYKRHGDECIMTVDLYDHMGRTIAKSDGIHFIVAGGVECKLGGGRFDALGNPPV